MTPQMKTLLEHLQKHNNISQAEASLLYKIRALPRRISDLKEAGINIRRELRVDPTGDRYARYFLVVKPKVGDRVRVISTGRLAALGGQRDYYYQVGAEGVILRKTSTEFYVRFDKPTVPRGRDAGREWYVGLDDVEAIS
jgi:hypothetical protein